MLTLQTTHSVVRPFVSYASVRLIQTLTNVDDDSLVYGKILHLAITFKAVSGSEPPCAQPLLSDTVSIVIRTCGTYWQNSIFTSKSCRRTGLIFSNRKHKALKILADIFFFQKNV